MMTIIDIKKCLFQFCNIIAVNTVSSFHSKSHLSLLTLKMFQNEPLNYLIIQLICFKCISIFYYLFGWNDQVFIWVLS